MTSSSIPYVVGNWVRGERFYGREPLIAEVLSGPRQAIWLLGTRRSGKTSLLRQLELLAGEMRPARYFPLFWDFQGAEDPAGLEETWRDALLDAEDRLEAIGVDLEAIEEQDLAAAMGHLRRHLRSRGLILLLLCDEVEELLQLRRSEPKLLRRLRRMLQSPDDVHSVLASSIRLWGLSETSEDTSPFLHGFTPPLYLRRLSDEAARALVRQDHLPPAARPALAPEVVDAICTRCGNHPYLLQLVAKRTLEAGGGDLGALVEACEHVANDQMVAHFFSVDLQMLEPVERRILAFAAAAPSASSGSLANELGSEIEAPALQGALFRLRELGYLQRHDGGPSRGSSGEGVSGGPWSLGNDFFRRWLLARQGDTAPAFDRPASATAAATGVSAQAAEERARRAASAGGTTREGDAIDGRYRILTHAGQGAHGVVYRVRDELLGAVIALKLLRPEYAGSDDALERLRQEVLLSRDLGHPNVVSAYHLGEWQGRIYITMPWIEGPTLTRVIREQAPLAPAEVAALGARIASALAAAHARKVLHRDLKPDNILMRDGKEPMITDFGLARLIGGPGLTRTSLFVGTPTYASPEQARQEELDERSDLYALGLILFELSTGSVPFRSETALGMLVHHSQTPAPDPRELRRDLPDELAAIVSRALSKERAARQASAGVLERELLALAARLDAMQTGTTVVPPAG